MNYHIYLVSLTGFQWASDLAQKTLLLFNMCSALSGTNAPMMNVTDHLSELQNPRLNIFTIL